MSNIPTGFDPKETFSSLLYNIRVHNPATRSLDISPFLAQFIADPIIHELLEELAQDPESPAAPDATTAQIGEIQTSLKSLTTAITKLQKQISSPNKAAKASSPAKGKASSRPQQKTYVATAGARPPNSSLVVDMSTFITPTMTWPSPSIVCTHLNERLRIISPTQAQLAAVRWTAKGNLIVTGTPNATPASLQSAAPHIGVILKESFKVPANTPFPNA
jgi:hypothetical protein